VSATANASVRISDEHMWRLLFNGLTYAQAAAAIETEGDAALIQPLLSARSVIV
jgi:hypothetical protein